MEGALNLHFKLCWASVGLDEDHAPSICKDNLNAVVTSEDTSNTLHADHADGIWVCVP